MKKVLCIIGSSVLLLTTACTTNREGGLLISISDKEEILNIAKEFNSQDIRNEEVSPKKNLEEVSPQKDLEEETRQKVYEIAKEKYLAGEWDGEPIVIEGKDVSFFEPRGEILVDGKFVISEMLDLPEEVNYTSGHAYIFKNGVYGIEDRKLVKYVRGERIEIGPVNYKGFNPQKPEEYNCTIDDWFIYLPNSEEKSVFDYMPLLFYVAEADELILATADPITDKKYLYRFPDYNSSELELISEVSYYSIFASVSYAHIEETFWYIDMNGIRWDYKENGPERKAYLFED